MSLWVPREHGVSTDWDQHSLHESYAHLLHPYPALEHLPEHVADEHWPLQ